MLGMRCDWYAVGVAGVVGWDGRQFVGGRAGLVLGHNKWGLTGDKPWAAYPVTDSATVSQTAPSISAVLLSVPSFPGFKKK